MVAYGLENAVEKDHYEVGPDTWVYLFEEKDKNYLLVSTDYTGDYEFEAFPHLLKLSNGVEFVLQREVLVVNDCLTEKVSNTVLFEYTD